MLNLFYRHPRLTIVTLALIVVSGLGALQTLPRMEDPRFTNRAAAVVTRWPGASATRIETLITEHLEEALESIPEIKELNSSSRAGVSLIQIGLHDSVGPDETDAIWSRVRDKLDDARVALPAGASDPDFNNDETYAYTLIAALVWELNEAESPVNHGILGRLAEDLEDRLRAVPGTEFTRIFGEGDEEIRVEIRRGQLARLGLTPEALAARIRSSDAKVAAGQLHADDASLTIEVAGEVDHLDRVRNILVQSGDKGRFVKLGDIATVQKTIADPPPEVAWINGRPGVAVAVRMEEGRRIDHWAAEARSVVEAFRADLSHGVGLEVLFDQSGYTETRLKSLAVNFLLGVAAVFGVILVLMGWRSALLVGASLPLAALMVLSGLRYLGIPIQQMSVTGLIIALGLLIDNAIVIVDEARRRLGAGEEPARAVAASVKHLAVPLLGSTLTTVFAFMPLVLMPGGAGEFVGSIAVSVILAILSSLFLSLTVIPALAGRLRPATSPAAGLRSAWQNGVASRRLARGYRRFLDGMLARPRLGIVAALTLPVLGFWGGARLTEQFFPPADRDQFQVQLRLPRQTSLEETRRVAERARRLLMAHERVSAVHWFVGDRAPMFYYNLQGAENGSAFFAQALVQLTTAENGAEVIRTLQKRLDAAFPRAQFLALQLEQGPPFRAPIELELSGPDVTVLARLGDEARRILASVPDVVHTRTSLADGRPKLRFELDEGAARLAGLDNVAIARQLEATLEGAVGGSMVEDTEELPVRVRLVGDQRRDLDAVASLDLYPSVRATTRSDRVGNVPLSSLGTLKLAPEIASIERRHGARVNTVMGYVTAGVLPGKALAEFRARLDAGGFVLPAGYAMRWEGESGQRDDAVDNLMQSVSVLLVLMVTTLVLSLGSFRLAGIVGVVGVASVGLGLGALWLFGYPFGFMAIVGTMGLIGVAINDAIVVMAALKGDPRARQGDREAVRDVVFGATRHVVSTTLTTVAGFTPLLVSGGGFWPPLAVAIAGGVVGTTLLALTFVPSAFVVVHRRAFAGAGAEAPAAARANELSPAPPRKRTTTRRLSTVGA